MQQQRIFQDITLDRGKIQKSLVMLDTNLVKIRKLPPIHKSTVLILHKLHWLHSIILKHMDPFSRFHCCYS